MLKWSMLVDVPILLGLNIEFVEESVKKTTFAASIYGGKPSFVSHGGYIACTLYMLQQLQSLASLPSLEVKYCRRAFTYESIFYQG